VEAAMTATYQLKSTGLTEGFLNVLQRTFAGRDITVRVETQDDKPLLKREGWIVPEGEENDPFYSVENLQYLNKVIAADENGTAKVVRKTFADLGINE
jgi:hypothetical protein